MEGKKLNQAELDRLLKHGTLKKLEPGSMMIELHAGEAALIYREREDDPTHAEVRVLINDPMIVGTPINQAASMALLGVAMHDPECTEQLEALMAKVQEKDLAKRVLHALQLSDSPQTKEH